MVVSFRFAEGGVRAGLGGARRTPGPPKGRTGAGRFAGASVADAGPPGAALHLAAGQCGWTRRTDTAGNP
ncbi:hypothetical protein GCM10010286_32260 [Streptomyces toxytricini]|nr:hypothetical protein GCM10010286_32260 [Streptomyces toxytricini]